jgi:hypothetical protein
MARTAVPDGDQQKQHQVTEQKFSLLISGQEIMTFDYGLPAELFMAKRKGGARSRPISRRFATAAEAIRFAVEDFPAIRALGAWMQVGSEIQWGRHPSPLREPPFSATTPNRLGARLTGGVGKRS